MTYSLAASTPSSAGRERRELEANWGPAERNSVLFRARDKVTFANCVHCLRGRARGILVDADYLPSSFEGFARQWKHTRSVDSMTTGEVKIAARGTRLLVPVSSVNSRHSITIVPLCSVARFTCPCNNCNGCRVGTWMKAIQFILIRKYQIYLWRILISVQTLKFNINGVNWKSRQSKTFAAVLQNNKFIFIKITVFRKPVNHAVNWT